MDFESEIRELQRRVGELEGAFNVLTGQIRNIMPELSRLQQESRSGFDAVSSFMQRIDERISAFDRRVSSVDLQVFSLRDDLPTLIGLAVKNAFERPSG